MRLRRIDATDLGPVRHFSVDGLSDLVVIAGPNGVGKTRLINGLIAHFQSPNNKNMGFVVEATHQDESSLWGKDTLNTTNAEDATHLQALLKQNRRRRNFKSSVVYYESNRTIQKLNKLNFQFEFPDPWEEPVSWDLPFKGLANRWEDTQHAIFKKIQSQKIAIATRAIQLRKDGATSMNLEFADPLTPFRDAFDRLLAPKTLHNADLQGQKLLYEENGETRDISTLSSGEREVLNITFDFILRQPSHCIVFFDEPELHLHPELLSRLINTLRSVGQNNQFILVSHSPDVIASSLNDSVVFLTPPRDDNTNQAVLLGEKSDATEILHRLGHSIGVISLGKKIVLIEGTESSLDKLTYSQIIQTKFPHLVLLPSGGKDNLATFNRVASEILDKTLWGIHFYMLADRDVAPDTKTTTERDNFRVLSKYHLENYFLEAEVLATCFRDMEQSDSWLVCADSIDKELRAIAQGKLAYATSLIVSKKLRDTVGNVSTIPKDIDSLTKDELSQAFCKKSDDESDRVAAALSETAVQSLTEDTYDALQELLNQTDNKWKDEFPGKPIFSVFCAKAGISEGRLKTLYLSKASEDNYSPFKEILDIFSHFSSK